MKLMIALILSFGVVAFANDYNGDPNMDIGLNSGTTEASFNDTTRAHQNSQRAQGKVDVASCPMCGEPTPMGLPVEPKTTVYLENGRAVSETVEATSKSGSPDIDPSNSNQ